jgi:hypothetical protein
MYSLGVLGDHSVTSRIPVMLAVASVVPVPAIVTVAEAVASTPDPSRSRALIWTGLLGTAAASIVACTGGGLAVRSRPSRNRM